MADIREKIQAEFENIERALNDLRTRVKHGAKYLSAKRTADLACGFTAVCWPNR